MADLAVNSNIVAVISGQLKTYYANAAITAGMTGYLDSSQLLYPGNAANAVSAGQGGAVMAMASGAVGQPIPCISSGVFNPGAAVINGVVYCFSYNSGKIAPNADMNSSDYVTIIGVGKGTNSIVIANGGIFITNILHG